MRQWAALILFCVLVVAACSGASQGPGAPRPVVGPAPAPVLPIGVVWEGYLADMTFDYAVREAVTDWNEALKEPVFVVGETRGKPVTLRLIKPVVKDGLIYLGFAYNGGLVKPEASWVVEFNDETPVSHKHTLALHELGHILGLLHMTDSRYRRDVMFQMPDYSLRLSTHDIDRGRRALWYLKQGRNARIEN